MKKNTYLGIIMALIAAIFWGASGNFAEYILNNSSMESNTYVLYRMVFSGIILTIYSIFINGKKDIKDILSNKIILFKLLVYSIVGIMLLQTTFAKAIEYSNAPFATLIQFLSPIIILFTISIKDKKLPLFSEFFLSFVALFGIFLMITNGDYRTIKVSLIAIIMGIFSAFTFAFYIMYIRNFFKYDTCLVIGLGMIIGGVLLAPFTNHSNFLSSMTDTKIILSFIFNVILGNVIPFYLFLESTRYIKESLTAIIGAFEPITALFISVFIMKTTDISLIQILGIFLIIISVTLLSIKEKTSS